MTNNIRYLQAITKAREAAEKVGDRETVMKLVQLYDKIRDRVEDIDKQKRQK